MKSSRQFQIFKQHVRDGMIKESIRIARNLSSDLEYYYAYIALQQQMIRMLQNIGPFPHDVYVEYCMLNHPHMDIFEKGGVNNE